MSVLGDASLDLAPRMTMPTSALDLVFDFMLSASPADVILQEQTAKEMMRLSVTQRNDRRQAVTVRARALLKMAADKRLQQWQERAWWTAECRGTEELLAIDVILEQAGLDATPTTAASVANLVRERDLYRDVLVNLVSRRPELADEVLALRSELRADAMSSNDDLREERSIHPHVYPTDEEFDVSVPRLVR